jgi:hypothetical protein
MTGQPRFFLRFGLRTMLLATLLVGLLLSWLVQRANHNREQRKQVQRVWRIGGAVNIEGSNAFELPVFPDEWKLEANKGWLYDARVDCRPNAILFPNHIGIKKKTSDADLDELIAAVRKMPTVKMIYLSKMFHSDAGGLKVKRAFPEMLVYMDNVTVVLPSQSQGSQMP